MSVNVPEGESNVEACFADRTKYGGTTLLGTDDGGSAVHRVVTGSASESQIEELPYAMVNPYCQYDAGLARKLKAELHPVVDIGVHPKSMYRRINTVDIPDLERPETWRFHILATWPYASDEDPILSTEIRY